MFGYSFLLCRNFYSDFIFRNPFTFNWSFFSNDNNFVFPVCGFKAAFLGHNLNINIRADFPGGKAGDEVLPFPIPETIA